MKLEEMSYDQLVTAACAMFGFTPAEVKEQFDTDDKLRAMLEEAKKGRGTLAPNNVEEDKLGWDSTDKTALDDEGQRIVSGLKAGNKKKLRKSIASAGGKVSETEVASAMSDIKKLLDSDDD